MIIKSVLLLLGLTAAAAQNASSTKSCDGGSPDTCNDVVPPPASIDSSTLSANPPTHGKTAFTADEIPGLSSGDGGNLYSAFDDASWAIGSTNLSSHHINSERQARYDAFINKCVELDPKCEEEEKFRIFMNANQPKSVNNYTKEGFKKIRAPAPLYKLLKDFWDKNKDAAVTEINGASAYHNSWEIPTSIVKTDNENYEGGGFHLNAAIWNSAREIIEEWTGQKLSTSSVYGIRIYHNQSILIPHVDRLPLISSAIINVDQDVDEPWFLEVYGHDGKATNVSMLPGDMVLYESASIIHGRPWPLNGSFYANIFVHFQPMGDLESELDKGSEEEVTRPPFLVEGSPFEKAYYKQFPKGWQLHSDVSTLINHGDLYTLRHLVKKKPGLMAGPNRRCAALMGAIHFNHVEIVQFLVGEVMVKINIPCGSFTALDAAIFSVEPDEPLISYLIENGAMTYKALAKQEDFALYGEIIESCILFEEAILEENWDMLEYLARRDYNFNVVCGESVTPRDMAEVSSPKEVIDFFDRQRAGTFEGVLQHTIRHGILDFEEGGSGVEYKEEGDDDDDDEDNYEEDEDDYNDDGEEQKQEE